MYLFKKLVPLKLFSNQIFYNFTDKIYVQFINYFTGGKKIHDKIFELFPSSIVVFHQDSFRRYGMRVRLENF